MLGERHFSAYWSCPHWPEDVVRLSGVGVLLEVDRAFTIAFTMRSGSNALCDLLVRNGMGAPGEYFQKRLPARTNRAWLEGFASLINQHEVNRIFGSKMSHDHRAALDERLRASVPGYRCLDDVLPGHRWVRLVRRDKVLQAISLCRAEVSNRWAMRGTDARVSSFFEYDFFHILSRVMILQASELAWDIYFQEQKIDPLLVVYEDFFADLPGQAARLIEHLGGLPQEHPAIQLDQSLAMQRDEESYALRERFLSEFTRVGETSLVQDWGEDYVVWTRFFAEKQWRAQKTTAVRSNILSIGSSSKPEEHSAELDRRTRLRASGNRD
jgi:LPS sulfotransferase NodH